VKGRSAIIICEFNERGHAPLGKHVMTQQYLDEVIDGDVLYYKCTNRSKQNDTRDKNKKRGGANELATTTTNEESVSTTIQHQIMPYMTVDCLGSEWLGPLRRLGLHVEVEHTITLFRPELRESRRAMTAAIDGPPEALTNAHHRRVSMSNRIFKH
jgi:hypothetical protein